MENEPIKENLYYPMLYFTYAWYLLFELNHVDSVYGISLHFHCLFDILASWHIRHTIRIFRKLRLIRWVLLFACKQWANIKERGKKRLYFGIFLIFKDKKENKNEKRKDTNYWYLIHLQTYNSPAPSGNFTFH